MAVLSRNFDAYLILVGPSGTILSNDDHEDPLTGASTSDSALRISSRVVGFWLAVVTTFEAGSTGSYRLRYEGITNIRRLERKAIDQAIVRRAFAIRDVINTREQHRRDIEDLVEQLSLRSYRQNLRDKLLSLIDEDEKDIEKQRRELAQLEERERKFVAALSEVTDLTQSQLIVRKMIDEKLRSVRFSVSITRDSAVAHRSSEVEAFRFALRVLNQLESAITELTAAEVRLLDGPAASETANLRRDFERLRNVRNSLSREIAEKLIDSRMVQRVPFNRFYSGSLYAGDGSQERRKHDLEEMVEQLSLRLYRQSLRSKILSIIPEDEERAERQRRELAQLEGRERDLVAALTEVEGLTQGKPLLHSMIDDELRSVRSSIKTATDTATDQQSEIGALRFALQALDQVESAATELTSAEARLLDGSAPGDAASIRIDIDRMRNARNSISREIAEKLIATEIVRF